jgi:hypothetical protein
MDLRLEYVQGTVKRQTASQSNMLSNSRQPEQSDDADDLTPLLLSSSPPKKSINSRGIKLADLVKKEKLYNQKFIDRVGWLDQITFARLEEIKQEVR